MVLDVGEELRAQHRVLPGMGWRSLVRPQHPSSLSHPTPQEKLKYFPVCVSTKPEPEDEAEEGLGGLPSNISSVSSLLLFNTTENLYGQKRGWLACGRTGGMRLMCSSSLQLGSHQPFGWPCTAWDPQYKRSLPLMKWERWVRARCVE